MWTVSAPLADLRFADVITFLAVERFRSISSAARELKVTPSQVSKAVMRLEQQLQLTLLTRTSHGVSLSEAALRILPDLEELVKRLQLLPRRRGAVEPELTVAAPSYLATAFLPRLAGRHPWLRLRGLQLAPALVRAYATENFFDMALIIGVERMPATWAVEQIGETRKALFGRREVAARLGKPPIRPEKLREVPFISPINHEYGHFVPDDDDCPVGRRQRLLGHEAQTMGLALAMAVHSSQVVFGPTIAARGYLERGDLVEIPVAGWDVRDPLFLACRGDRVMARVRKAVVETLRAAIAELELPPH
jgi:DNA-binding transcriptional LysR family regulator